MTWFRIDDRFAEHPKVELLEADQAVYPVAMTAWLVMGLDCAKRETIGEFSRYRMLRVLPLPEEDAIRAAEALVRVGLWQTTTKGFRFKDWEDYNPSKEELVETKKSNAERQKLWRQRNKKRLDSAKKAELSAAHVENVTPLRNVTRNEDSNVTRNDGTVTPSVTETVTPPLPYRTVPNLTVPSYANAYETRAREDDDENPQKAEVETFLRTEYARQYKLAKNDVWMSHAKAARDISLVALWALAGGDPIARAQRCLDGVFADEWMRGSGWPWGSIARDPGRFFEPPKKDMRPKFKNLAPVGVFTPGSWEEDENGCVKF